MLCKRIALAVLAFTMHVHTAHAECGSFEVCADGWTKFTASPDTRIIYVSSSTGNDANNGLSPATPKRSIQAAHDDLLRDGYPDWLLLKAGDSFDTSAMPPGNNFITWQKGGRSTSEPMRLGSYGSGPRPRLKTGLRTGFYSSGYPMPKAHLAITDLEFYSETFTGQGHITGVVFLNGWSDVLLENCVIREYAVNVQVQQIDSGSQYTPRNIRLRRNVITDAYSTTTTSTGIFVGGAGEMLVEENLFDHNGWREGVAAPNNQSHNTYFHSAGESDGVYRGNIVTRASAHGLNPRGGGLVEGNLIVGNAVGLPAHANDAEDSLIIRQNVVMDVRGSPDPWVGYGITVEGTHFTIEDNIIAHATHEVPNMIGLGIKAGLVQEARITNNIVYNWTAPLANPAWSYLVRIDQQVPNGGTLLFRGNELQQTIYGNLLEYYFLSSFSGTTFQQNKYYSVSDPNGSWYSPWLAASHEQGSQYARITYPDAARNVSTYMQRNFFDEEGLRLFLAEARQQSKSNWRDRYTARAVINYVREGFGRAPINGTPTQPEPTVYAIAASNGAGGTISPQGSVLVNEGEDQTFTITPNAGYRIANVVVDSTIALGAVGTYTFHEVEANHSISATFTPISSGPGGPPEPEIFTIEVEQSGAGVVKPGSSISVAAGGNIEFIFLPNPGYRTTQLSLAGQLICSGECPDRYTVSNVQANQFLFVRFEAIPVCERVDLNGDQRLNILDYVAFLQLFPAGDLRTDINLDGALDLFDFYSFTNEYATCAAPRDGTVVKLKPGTISPRAIGADKVRLTWRKPTVSLTLGRRTTKPSYFLAMILRSDSPNGVMLPVAIPPPNGKMEFVDTTAQPNTRYFYSVLFVGDSGVVTLTNIAPVLTPRPKISRP